eukprot:scaffold8677_cov44-Cyclotella_meneghiniana.AAC.3
MWIVNKPQDRTSSKSAQRMLVAAAKDCQRHHLLPLTFKHRDYGGATTAQHIIGFSAAFGLSTDTFSHPPNVDRTLRYFWKPAEKLVQPVHLDREPPAVVGNHKRPLKFKDSLRLEGLFPVSDPHAFVCGPSVFHPGKSVHRKLTQGERMALFDVPSDLMDVFKSLGAWGFKPLPFERSISPVIMTSLFRQLWGTGGGSLQFVTTTTVASPELVLSEEFEAESVSEEVSLLDLEGELVTSVGDDSSTSCSISSESYDMPALVDIRPSDFDSDSDPSSSASTDSEFDTTAGGDRSFDPSSAEDSFMPRKKVKSHSNDLRDDDCWEFLDDVSVGTTVAETDDATGTSKMNPSRASGLWVCSSSAKLCI